MKGPKLQLAQHMRPAATQTLAEESPGSTMMKQAASAVTQNMPPHLAAVDSPAQLPPMLPPTQLPPTQLPSALPSTQLPPTQLPSALPSTQLPPMLPSTQLPSTQLPSTVSTSQDQQVRDIRV